MDTQQPNGLLSQPAPPPPGTSPAADPSASEFHEPLTALHDQAKAQFQAVDKVDQLAQVVRKGLDSLTKKGTAVTQDDVLDEMAVLVTKGADPKALSALMAGGNGSPPMPDSGEALAQWVAQQDQMVQQRETALAPQKTQAGLGAVTSALHLLTHDHIQRTAPAASATASTGNTLLSSAPLTPGRPNA